MLGAIVGAVAAAIAGIGAVGFGGDAMLGAIVGAGVINGSAVGAAGVLATVPQPASTARESVSKTSRFTSVATGSRYATASGEPAQRRVIAV
jgi:hypothetical protein